MNTRFRAGFCSALGRVVPGELRAPQSTAMTEHSVIQRVNTIGNALHDNNSTFNKMAVIHEDVI